MKIGVLGGRAVYARWKVGDKYVYTEKERDRLIERLDKQGVEYTVEEYPEPPGFEVTHGIKYASRSEALRHIEQGIEPESLTVVRLQERLQAVEEKAARVDLLENRLQSLEKAQKIAQEGEK